MPAISEYPQLELTFAKECGNNFLIDARFKFDEPSATSRKLTAQPPRSQTTLRAICILMLLAKYQGESFAVNNVIEFFANNDERSWIKTLIESLKTSKYNILDSHFQALLFVSASLGSRHKTENRKAKKGAWPSLGYDTVKLPLQNLQFYTRPRKATEDKKRPLTEKELARFAKKLEAHEVKQPDSWKAMVPSIVAITKQDRPSKRKTNVEKEATGAEKGGNPFVLTARWRELGDYVRKNIEGQVKAGNWYVICISPSWLLDWKGVFFDAVIRHKAKIQFAYHSPSAAENCPAVKAQWRMNYHSYVSSKSEDPVDYVVETISEIKKILGGWCAELKANSSQSVSSQSGFDFYESYIPHPFMAIMHTPSSGRRVSGPAWGAPEGTQCMLGLYPLYPDGIESRCGLYLNGRSPMLDIYYKSVFRFFQQGPKDGHLKPVDLFQVKSKSG